MANGLTGEYLRVDMGLGLHDPEQIYTTGGVMIAFLKKWWFWVAILVALLFLWQSISGFAYSKKLWNMVKAEIVADEHRIIEELEKDNLQNQKDKETLYRQIDQLKNQRVELQKDRDRLLVRIREIENALENVSIPNDPDALVDLLRKNGLKSIHRRKR